MVLLKRLFNRLDTLFLLSKSIDLILLTIGLLAAIQVNSYIYVKQNEKIYKKALIKIHTEISINKILLQKYSNSIDSSKVIIYDLEKLANNGFSETYNGIIKVNNLGIAKLKDRSFRAYDKDVFLDKNIYNDIKLLYNEYYKLENSWDTLYNHTKETYRSYFKIFATQKLAHLGSDENYKDSLTNSYIVNIANFYNYGSKTLKKDHYPKIHLKNSFAYSDLILNKIEDELELNFDSKDDFMEYDDYYWLSYYSLMDENYKDAISYAHKGIQLLNNVYFDEKYNSTEFNSFNSRLNRNIVSSINLMIKSNDSTYEKEDILPFLNEWYKSGIYLEACIVEFLDYFYRNNDFDSFLKYTKYIFELDSQNYYIRYVSFWPNFMAKDSVVTVLKKSNISIDTWNSYIFPGSM